MNIGASRYGWKEQRRECESKSIAHCIYEDVGHKKTEGVVCKYHRADGLTKQSESRPGTAENIMTSCEVEEMYGRRVKMNVETFFDAPEYIGFIHVVVASINDAGSFRPTLLSRADSCPEDTLAAASCITAAAVLACIYLHDLQWLLCSPEWVEEAHHTTPVPIGFSAVIRTAHHGGFHLFPIIVVLGSLRLPFVIRIIRALFGCYSGQQQLSSRARCSAQVATGQHSSITEGSG